MTTASCSELWNLARRKLFCYCRAYEGRKIPFPVYQIVVTIRLKLFPIFISRQPIQHGVDFAYQPFPRRKKRWVIHVVNVLHPILQRARHLGTLLLDGTLHHVSHTQRHKYRITPLVRALVVMLPCASLVALCRIHAPGDSLHHCNISRLGRGAFACWRGNF
jgi:hypothetical protein